MTNVSAYTASKVSLVALGMIGAAALIFAWATPSHAQSGVPLYTQIAANIGQGSSGTSVRALQTYLASNPMIYPQGLMTGYYGALTTEAVKQFQLAYGIEPVGRVGPITRAKLNQLIASNTPLDVSGPVLTGNPQVSVSGTSANISVSTNENARIKVFYSPSAITGNEASAPQTELALSGQMSDNQGFMTGRTVNLTGLTANTTYHFVVEAIDQAGNVTVTNDQTFTTGS